jgi:hypothetical protein
LFIMILFIPLTPYQAPINHFTPLDLYGLRWVLTCYEALPSQCWH